MTMLKRCLNNLVAVFAVIATLSSCNSGSTIAPLPQEQTRYGQPVSRPLEFSTAKKLDWAGAKTIIIQPLVKKFSIDDLPAHPYDSLVYKPFSKPVTGEKINFDSIPAKPLDIDKLPSKPLVYKTYLLPQPKLIKAGMPELKDPTNPFLYELGKAQGIQGEVRSVIKDRDGFIWILTGQNLYRYDGENLLLYVSVDQQILQYQYFIEDDRGRFWITYGNAGVEVIDPKKGLLMKSDGGHDLSNDALLKVFEDKQQRIWITYFSGAVTIINSKTLTVCSLTATQGPGNKFAFGFAADSDKIWLPTVGGGLDIIDLKNKNIKTVNKANGLERDSITAITKDRSGNIWMAYWGGTIDVINPATGAVQRIYEVKAAGGDFINDLTQDKYGRMMVSAADGLFIIDLPKHLLRRLYTGNGLIGDYVWNAVEDKAGQLWIGTSKGINIINPDNHIAGHIGSMVATSSYQDEQGLLWLASPYYGIDIYDPMHKTYRHLGKTNGIADDSIQFVKAARGLILLGTFNGMDIIDPLKKTLTHFDKKQGFTNNVVNMASIDNDGKIWIGGRAIGLDIYDPKNNRMKHIGAKQGFTNADVTDITWDIYGRAWINTSKGGVNIIDTTKGSISVLKNTSDLNGVPQSFAKDKWGNIWFSTAKGISVADLKTNRLLSFSAAFGDKTVFNLLQQNGNIYIGDYNGVSKITPPADGIDGKDKWKTVSYSITKANKNYFQTDAIGSDGLYYWGDSGFTVIDLSKKDANQPPLYITGISIMDTPCYFVAKRNLRQTDTLWDQNNDKYITGDNLADKINLLKTNLSYDSVAGPYNMPVNLSIPNNENYLQFNFASFGKAAPDSTLYQYVLVGADKKWSGVTVATSSHIYYGLPPGKYTFEVSRLFNGKWETPVEFSFVISPPWWQTWWARILYILLFAGVIWCFVYYRSKQLIKANRVLEQKIRIRTEEVLQQKEEIEAQRDHLEIAVSELKQTQQQLIQSEKMASLGELTAVIAHEIQNPLNFVNNFSEVSIELLDELKEEAKAGNNAGVMAIADDLAQNLDKITHHGKRADFIVKGMLQHSRTSTGDKQITNINMLADEFLKLSYHGLRAKNKSFNAEMLTHFDKDLPKINVVQQDIGRVLLNLFNNAFYAVSLKKKTAGTVYKPEVIVSTSAQKNNVIIKVKDNGNGIPDAIRDKIMQPFFTTKPTGEGTGLGLSLSYDMVVNGHGGSITVESREGEGTEFTVTLPLA